MVLTTTPQHGDRGEFLIKDKNKNKIKIKFNNLKEKKIIKVLLFNRVINN